MRSLEGRYPLLMILPPELASIEAAVYDGEFGLHFVPQFCYFLICFLESFVHGVESPIDF